MHWAWLPFRRAFEYSGRSTRREFYAFLLVFWLGVPVLLAAVIPALFPDFEPGFLAVGVLVLILLVPTMSLIARRFHDFGRPGWWSLIVFVPVIGMFVLALWLYLEGASGTNRYGPDPRGGRRSPLNDWFSPLS